MGHRLVFSYKKNHETQRSQVPIFRHDNNTTAEFDSGISYPGTEGQNTV